jgi:hypothetical protein
MLSRRLYLIKTLLQAEKQGNRAHRHPLGGRKGAAHSHHASHDVTQRQFRDPWSVVAVVAVVN